MVMGPTAGLVFAELGADVIKVESAPRGDHTCGLGGLGVTRFHPHLPSLPTKKKILQINRRSSIAPPLPNVRRTR